jgi:hypothetical protein
MHLFRFSFLHEEEGLGVENEIKELPKITQLSCLHCKE